MIPSYQKIFTIGTNYIADIFKGPVEITEKLDGSHFKFGIVDGTLHLGSKKAVLYASNPNKNFIKGIEYIESIQNKIPPNIAFYAEYFNGPRQNTLKYDRIPTNHIILFGAMEMTTHKVLPDIQPYADRMGLECAPVLYKGTINHPNELDKLLETRSILGDIPIEGVVVKNYAMPFLLGSTPFPMMVGKWVSSSFKEVHNVKWDKTENKKNRLQVFFDSYCTESRWQKAYQHLHDEGKLSLEAKDIGVLIKEIQKDIVEEEKEEIITFLWKEFKGELLRKSTRGFPEWYKNKLIEDHTE